MDEILKQLNRPGVQREYAFTTLRGFKFDYAWPKWRIAIEVQGFGGGHSSIGGLQRDYEKLNHATAIGWMVFQFSTAMLKKTDYCVSVLNRAFEERLSPLEYPL